MSTTSLHRRRTGLFGAIGIGVGAIVGGGILALSGLAFSITGPGALLAFTINGLLAIITALSFAELATAYPQSGGPYAFAKRVMSVGAAFSVGWVVWFASIVAAALYAIGFAAFTVEILKALFSPEAPPDWLESRFIELGLALAATGLCCFMLIKAAAGPLGATANVVKVTVFGVLIAGGLWVWLRGDPEQVRSVGTFFPAGAFGLVQAMGYTFIALQGFDLIAAAAGEIDKPRRNIPLAMLISLGIALAVYLPLLWVVLVVGTPLHTDIQTMAAVDIDSVIARAAQHYLGSFGLWMVLLAGVLAMFTALLANLMAAALIARSMAEDRTLPPVLERLDPIKGTPPIAILMTGGIAFLTMLVAADLGIAGASASLIFLICFALTHGICILARVRRPDHDGFKVPGWPVVPAIGLLGCLALAVFQGIVVPTAGLVVGLWLCLGFFCYLWLFGRRARVQDAANEARDPDLLELRGRSPLVLVPIANPQTAGTMAQLAASMAPPRVGRVLMLNVYVPSDHEDGTDAYADVGQVLRRSLAAAIKAKVRVECLATVSKDPWAEIERVAKAHRCATVLLGMNSFDPDSIPEGFTKLAARLPGNVVLYRSPPDWAPPEQARICIPIGGHVVHNAFRARFLTGLHRRLSPNMIVSYLLVLPEGTSEHSRRQAEERWNDLVADETRAESAVEVVLSDDVSSAIIAGADAADMVVIGMGKDPGGKRALGPLTGELVKHSRTPVVVIGQGA